MTLTQLIEQVRRKADMENSTFVSDAEVTSYINESYSELYDLLVSRFEDYFTQSVNFTITSGNAASLPGDFYKSRGLDYQVSGLDFETVRQWSFQDRNRIDQGATRLFSGVNDRTYRIMAGQILILPTDKAPGSYRLWYIPRYLPLVNASDVMGDVLDFTDYVVVDAAIKCLMKEESDTQMLMIQKMALKNRVEAMASNRNTEPETIVDVRKTNTPFGWPFGGGY